MKKFAIQSILLLAIIGGGIFFFNPNGSGKKIDFPFLPSSSNLTSIQIGNVLVKAEIADTSSKRNKGLGGRDSLASDSGMLFVFDKVDRHNFWMKGMKIPLDFIWILDDKVVDITENVPPQVGQPDNALKIYSSKTETNKMLEVNAGFISVSNIKVGDTVIVN